MTMNNTENNGTKRKYLVPLVVLLLCGVAMTGAAYAYNSTMSTSDDLNTHSFEISTSSSEARVVTITLSDIEMSSAISAGAATYSIVNGATQTVTFYMKNAVNTDGMTLTVNSCTLDETSDAYLNVATSVTDNGTNSVVTLTFSLDSATITEDVAKTMGTVTVTLSVSAANAAASA